MKLRAARKYSLFTLVLILISAGTAIYLPLSVVLEFQDRRDEIILDHERRLVQYLKMAESLYRAGADEDLTALLRQVLKERDIDYFAIYQNGELTHTEPSNNALASGHTYSERAPKAGKDLIDEIRSERSEFLSETTLLTLGIDKRHPHLLMNVFFGANLWKIILQDILIVIGLAAFAFWLHARDLMKLKNEIAKYGRVPDSFGKSKSLSAESEAIMAGLKGYAQAEKQLQEKSEKLSAQVLPALKRELFSGQTPPYTFECTLVRTDINGFSQIFNSPYRDRFAKHIDDFFVGLTEIVSRYDGLIYEFVGDEAIFYFKDYTSDDFQDQLGPSTSLNRAIDAIRDIHSLAQDIGLRTNLEGHRFTVKSALAHGTLRFGPQVDGFSLSGGVLIETVRILSTVTDKQDNHLYFASKYTAHLRDDLVTEKVGVFSLKGYSEDVAIVRWSGAMPLSTHIANVTSTAGTVGGFDFVSQHRSDFSLETIIAAAAAAKESWTLKHHLALVHSLRSIKVYKAHHPLGETLGDWIAAARMIANATPEWNRLVAAILTIYPLLVPKAALNDKVIASLESLLDSTDSRIVANVIDILTRYELAPKVRPLKGLFASENNRIAANALIHEGTRDLSETVLEKIELMAFGKTNDETRRASGLYALGEIVRILRARDPVYYSTRIDLHRLVARAADFADHENESIATQASRVLAKAEVTDIQSAA